MHGWPGIAKIREPEPADSAFPVDNAAVFANKTIGFDFPGDTEDVSEFPTCGNRLSPTTRRGCRDLSSSTT